ncbi:peptidase M16 [Novosphingobium sp. PC22D]|uniref:M16 family metallopeptidase n=1 Tax=Novosphingobium sp. PC22D TaxID=1962403 RepID=UPI000BF057B4|nr:insulinase family protein [Novosphingobium sp. PC22D]PEQ13740.1 peptidase M16 [Novosphingobium sp. PC22D]
MKLLRLFAALLSALLPIVALPAPALAAPARDAAIEHAREPVWGFEDSDIPLDPAYRFGRLGSGLRYVIRKNATPEGTALVRMIVEAGSLDEKEAERGLAHFVEHMAFNGSARVPEGEMVPLLERNGLAFGADTNASTGFERTTYKLDLPRNDPALLDTALMLMRETASELMISPGAVDRERGVVLAEMRDRNTWSYRDTVAGTNFFYAGSRFAQRFPIGTEASIKTATAKRLREFYEREYVPGNVTVVIVGDFEPDLVERAILAHFADWTGPKARPRPDAGPIRNADIGRTDVYIDPAVSERIVAQRTRPYTYEADTVAARQENLLAQVGYGIVNRRFKRLSRSPDPPFRGAGFGTGDVFDSARATRLIVDTVDRTWRRGLIAAAREYRRALLYGFSEAEVAEQLANIRNSLENAAAGARTQSNGTLYAAVEALLSDGTVPSQPATVLARFEAFAPQITPERVMAALVADAAPLENPNIRLRTRFAPAGDADAVRAAWNEAMLAAVSRESSTDLAGFAYTDFGPAGVVVSDKREPALGIRQIVFANGVMLNVKHTEIEKDRVRFSVSIDGGDMLDTKANPLATEMVPYLDEGGLARHSSDDLQTILAGRSVSDGFRTSEASFDSRGITTPRDLEVQLQLLTAYIVDPGYRAEGQLQFRQQMNTYFKRKDATPGSALGAAIGGILSDDDPRFTLQPVEAYRRLTFAKLRRDIAGRLEFGAIEIGIVGDIEEEQAIALVAATFGALPDRERRFRDYSGQQQPRVFAEDRTRRVVRHEGASDQALLRFTWPTRDDSDMVEALRLDLLERVVRVELTDTLREKLGKSYSPQASSALSHNWKGYGTFAVQASVDVGEVAATSDAIRATIAALRAQAPSDDLLQRARQPLLERFQNALKSNAGWLALVDRAQSEPARIDRYLGAGEILMATTPADLQALALRYLDPDRAIRIVVVPQGVALAPEGDESDQASPIPAATSSSSANAPSSSRSGKPTAILPTPAS